MTDDLTSWLRAQLDDDEQSIRTWESACVHIDACDDTGDFMGRFGEDRLLADVDAKRRILDEHPVIPEPYGSAGHCERCIDPEAGGPDPAAVYPCTTVRLLALPHADHPGYREEWKP